MNKTATQQAWDLLQAGRIPQSDFDEIERFEEFLKHAGKPGESSEWLKQKMQDEPEYREWLGMKKAER